jgi:mRNA interferase MazF
VISRGEIHFVELDPVKGREQAGRRPVLVVSSNAINRLPLVVTVVAGSDGANFAEDYPSNVRIPAKESGLPNETVFLCFQLRSIDPARFADRKSGRPHAVGRLPPATMREVDAALRRCLALGE